jgi:hypothetical protein
MEEVGNFGLTNSCSSPCLQKTATGGILPSSHGQLPQQSQNQQQPSSNSSSIRTLRLLQNFEDECAPLMGGGGDGQDDGDGRIMEEDGMNSRRRMIGGDEMA